MMQLICFEDLIGDFEAAEAAEALSWSRSVKLAPISPPMPSWIKSRRGIPEQFLVRPNMEWCRDLTADDKEIKSILKEPATFFSLFSGNPKPLAEKNER